MNIGNVRVFELAINVVNDEHLKKAQTIYIHDILSF